MATVRNVYVDTDCAGTGDGSGFGANCKYTSLNQAEQAEDDTGNLTTTDEYVVFHCRGVTAADTAAVSVNGWTTDATRYIQIQCDSGDRHSGVWTTSKYRLVVPTNTALALIEEYVRVDGLQVHKSSSSAHAQATIQAGQSGTSDVRISNCVLRQAGNASWYEPVIYINNTGITRIWNCIGYGAGANTTYLNSCVVMTSGSTVSVYSSTLIAGGASGIYTNNASCTCTAKNCYATHGSLGAYVQASGTLNKTTCASSDTTGSVGLQNIAYSTSSGAYFTNVTAGYEDFRISSASSALVNAGTTLTDDPPGAAALGVDIAGQTRA